MRHRIKISLSDTEEAALRRAAGKQALSKFIRAAALQVAADMKPDDRIPDVQQMEQTTATRNMTCRQCKTIIEPGARFWWEPTLYIASCMNCYERNSNHG